jgi:serine/threonine protein kinase
MMQLILAIDLMHRNDIIHRDIKADNILLMDREKWQVSISDLGLACSMDDEVERRVKCGTPGYVAPEVLLGIPFTPKADIFSLGCFMFNMITCSNLFGGRNNREILAANKHINPHQIVDLRVNNVSNDCKSLLKWMLECNPDKRPSAE